MDKLIIEGGRPLRGSVTVSGAKNAALPILFGAILCESPVTFRNVPDLRDIHTTLTLLDILGCGTSFAEGTVRAVPGALRSEAPYDLVRTMRASVLCLGPLLARLGRARVAMPGGCAIGARPVDLHLSALEKMGARFDLEEGYIQGRVDGGLRGARIQFDFPTVGGTENLIMAAALARGETLLENAAREPEIVDLVRFLRRCGARIEGEGGGTLRIEGVPSLQGCEYAIMPDRIEAGTFLVAAAITDGELTLLNCPHDDMEALLTKLEASGLSVESRGGGLTARRAGGVMCGVDIATLPHPGFPTDMQAQFMALLCLAEGASSIEETIFENRFMHVPELLRMGANIRLSGSSAFIRGVKALAGAPVMASDLRASASLVLAGLAARGTTTVRRIYHLDRGYEHMERKLQAVGAAIRRVRDDA